MYALGRRDALLKFAAEMTVPGAPPLLDVPSIRQFNEYTCGPASLLAVLSYWGKYDGNEQRLAKLLGTDKENGTGPEDLVRVAQTLGLESWIKYSCGLEELKQALESQAPVIVNFQAWSDREHPPWKHNWGDGHYAVLIGMDADYVYMRDPALFNRVGVLPIDEFVRRWHDITDDKVKYQRLAIFFKGERPTHTDRLAPIQ